jgi:SAM-dependent methyltransferase
MDRAKVEAFLETFIGLAAGTTTIGLLAIADRTGLSSWLAANSGGSLDEISTGSGLDRRYLEEILSGLTAAGVLELSEGVFTLPPEHALFLADETSPYFMGGWMDMLPAVIGQIDGIAEATRTGGGVRFEDFGPGMIRGLDRGNSPSQRVFLTRKWLPAVPGLVDRLNAGSRVADVGCGSGTAVIEIAGAYPNSDVYGFDLSDRSLELARARSSHLPNAHFEKSGVEEIPVEPGFDLITSFDVIHDLTDPLAAMRRIRSALSPDGLYLMMEPAASSDLEGNLTPRGALLYGISTLHCMTQSLARGGAGLGAAWGTARATDMAGEAGFRSFDQLEEISNSFSSFYLLQP